MLGLSRGAILNGFKAVCVSHCWIIGNPLISKEIDHLKLKLPEEDSSVNILEATIATLQTRVKELQHHTGDMADYITRTV